MTSSKTSAQALADAARSPSHSRFIPREEIASFAAWNPASLSGRTGPAARSTATPTADKAATTEAEARAQAAAVQAARQSGYQDGYRDGLVALESFKQSFAQQTTAQIGALVASLGAELEGLQQAMADAIVVTATRLARQVVRSEIGAEPARVAQVAREAVDALLLTARHVTVRVHPDDHAFVVGGAAEVLAARGARAVADASISRGGCVVESDIGAIDASLETRWRRAAGGIGSHAGWHDQPPPVGIEGELEDNATVEVEAQRPQP